MDCWSVDSNGTAVVAGAGIFICRPPILVVVLMVLLPLRRVIAVLLRAVRALPENSLEVPFVALVFNMVTDRLIYKYIGRVWMDLLFI